MLNETGERGVGKKVETLERERWTRWVGWGRNHVRGWPEPGGW